jgi:hypothetical protein
MAAEATRSTARTPLLFAAAWTTTAARRGHGRRDGWCGAHAARQALAAAERGAERTTGVVLSSSVIAALPLAQANNDTPLRL